MLTPSLTSPVSRTVRLSMGARLVHRGCFARTPTPPLLGRRTPRRGPRVWVFVVVFSCVCVCSCTRP